MSLASSSRSTTRLLRPLARQMHTPGRQIPNHPTPTTSPHNPSQHPSPDFPPDALSAAEAQHSGSGKGALSMEDYNELRYKYRGKLTSTKNVLPDVRISDYHKDKKSPKSNLKTPPPRPVAPTTFPRTQADQINPHHPLHLFFRQAEETERKYPLGGMGLTLDEVKGLPAGVTSGAGEGVGGLEGPEDADKGLKSGRSYTASELRSKSFHDLHTLWYLLLRERNVLATQREERRRLLIATAGGPEAVAMEKRGYRCRKTMSRIKYILNERRLALISAAQSTRPASHPQPKIEGISPLGSVDPMALSGWEEGIKAVGVSEVPVSGVDYPQKQKGGKIFAVGTGAGAGAVIGALADREGLSGGLGDGERQKMDLGEEGEGESVVEGESVAQEEVEGRDEGFGGGREARDFVEDVNVKV